MLGASYADEQTLCLGERFTLIRAQTSGHRPVVIKTVRPDREAARSDEQLEREYELLTGLDDVAGIARPIAFEITAGRPALVLEDAGPSDVAELLSHGHLEIGQFLELALQMAAIVARIHARYVIHRDICPANFVLDGAGKLTLVDFGIAARAFGPPPLPGQPSGTLAYVAPEQAGRVTRGNDPRSDLYSLGATFYEMLTGTPPFPMSDPIELVHAHLARVPSSPSVVNPAVPRMLSEIVVKLLAKSPESRYQSAEALLADLTDVNQHWRASRIIPPFELGRQDLARQLPLPSHLYGREQESARLTAAFRRIERGASEICVVTGPEGVGKTAFVASLHAIADDRGRMLTGTCDALRADEPLAPLIDALREAVQTVLSGPTTERAAFRRRLLASVGDNGRALLDELPALREIIGDEASLAPLALLGPLETENRFHLVVSRFLRALSDRPVVLFLDDVHRADAATLKLLGSLVADPDANHLLVVVTLPDVALGADSAVSAILRDAGGRGGMPVHTIELGALDRDAVRDMLSDTLHMPPDRVAPLADVIVGKTQGSPLFIVRLLRLLQTTRLLVYGGEAATWSWDLPRIAELPVSDNVVDLLVDAMRGLPEDAVRVLETAACLGTHVDVALLALVCERSNDETVELLREPVLEGFLTPTWTDKLTYRFAHDRVQQAAYSVLSEEGRRALHLRIGRALLAESHDEVLESRLFEIADQLNLGAPAIVETSERMELAGVNLKAGQKARTRSAHEAALRYFQRGLEILPEASWREGDELWLSLHREAVECAYLSRRHALGDALMNEALILAAPLDKANLCHIRVEACTMRGAFDEAVRWARDGLQALDVDLPEPAKVDLEVERLAVEVKLAARPPPAILELPVTHEAADLVAMKLLSDIGVAARLSGQADLWTLAALRRTSFALEHGNSACAPVAYAGYAMLRTRYDDYVGAERFGKLALELGQRIGTPTATVRSGIYHAAFVNHWCAPLQTSPRLLKERFDQALECGDFAFAAHARAFGAMSAFASGKPLGRVLLEAEDGLAFCVRVGHKAMADYTLVHRQAVRALQGLTRGSRFDCVEFSEREFLDGARHNPTGLFLFRALRMQVAYLLGDLEEASQMLRATEETPRLKFGFIAEADQRFYAALTVAAAADRAPRAKEEHVAEIKRHAERLALWAKSCPANFEHKHALVAAELARVEGRDADATRLYRLAIEGAGRQGFSQDEALAHELGGRFYLRQGMSRIAALYLGAALDGYASWGASAKVVALQKELSARKIHVGPRSPVRASGTGISLDLQSLLKAAETLSGEVVFDRLLEKLMNICIEAAGAERALLVVEESNAPVVRAIGTATGDVVVEHVLLARAPNVPVALIEHVRQTGEVVVLADAAKAGLFVGEPDVRARGVRSVLALPLERHGQRVGVLYLENNLAAGVFSQERVHVFEMLSAQVAISLENSRLFERLQGEIAQRAHAEGKVGFLAAAGVALAETLAYEPTLARVARVAVPFLADWCVVDVTEEGEIHRQAYAHVDPKREPILAELTERYPPDWSSSHPAAVALRSGEAQLYPELTATRILALSKDAEHARLLTEVGMHTVMAVPLVAHGRTIGAITFASAHRGRTYARADLDLAEEIARRAAVAIDNARLYAEAKKAVRVRDDFLSAASHELRTPITSLQLACEGILSGAIRATPDNVGRTFRNSHRQVTRLAELIDELLTVSSIEADHVVLDIDDVDLRSVVTDTVEGLANATTRAGSHVVVQPGPPIVGQWDRRKLEQVVTNLLTNAIKFGAGKGIEIDLETTDDKARLVVTDHGIGIPPDRMPHVFERYERAVSAKQYGGLGLGLFVVRWIVEALHGTVGVDNVEGGGATFSVELPLAGPFGDQA